MAPARHYLQRLREREALAARLDGRQRLLGNLRLSLAAAFLILAWSVGRFGLAPSWLVPPSVLFIALVLMHRRIRRARAEAGRAAGFHAAGLERLEGRWPATEAAVAEAAAAGSPHAAAPDALRGHLYGADLDLFGSRSVFALLCAARTSMGALKLTEWLLAPAAVATLHQRHASVTELSQRLDFREDMSVRGEPAFIGLESAALVAWAGAPNELEHSALRWAAPVLAALALVAAALWATTGAAYPLLGVLLVEVAVTYGGRARVTRTLAGFEAAYEDIKLLATLLRRVEVETFTTPALQALQGRFKSQTLGAAAVLARLATVVNFVEARRNPFLTPLSLPLMYPQLTALAAERWRRTHGAALAHWLDGLGEFEALLSLARYRFEHPEQPFPEFLEGPATFDAEGLGHPLIDAASRVRNDVVLAGETRVLLVSGSNMSGKSTLLRCVGVNTVLAMAGAPVCATRLRLTPVQLGASIRVNDSLAEGSSRFYAEITRLRQLFEPAALPLLFLLDELLQGTNSNDRRIGAEGVVRALIERGAIGLVSTHDLALAELGGLPARALRNVHFRDGLEGGRLSFDFQLREGIVTQSNGIELMRSIGLEV